MRWLGATVNNSQPAMSITMGIVATAQVSSAVDSGMWCGAAFITTSTITSSNFIWSTSKGFIKLNVVEVSLLCQ